MAQAQIKTQKIIGGNLTTGQTSVAVLGSTASGSTVYTLDVDTQQNTQWLNGINDNVIVQNPNPTSVTDYNPLTTYSVNQYAKDPMTQLVYISLINNNLGNPFTDASAWKNVNYKFFPYQETINSIGNVLSNNVAAIQQEGFLPYLSTTTYNQFALVKKTGTAEIYQSLIPNNLGNSLSDPASWALLVDLADIQTKALPLPSNQDCNVLGLNGAYGTFGVSSAAASTLANAPNVAELATALPSGVFVNQKIPFGTGATNYYIQQFYIINIPTNSPQIFFTRIYYAPASTWTDWETTAFQALGSIVIPYTNLNECTKNGFYFISSTVVGTLLNSPVSTSEWQLSCTRNYNSVTTATCIVQTLTLLSNTATVEKYERSSRSNVGWSSWVKTAPLPVAATVPQILAGTDDTIFISPNGLAQSKGMATWSFAVDTSPTTATKIAQFGGVVLTNSTYPLFFSDDTINTVTVLVSGWYKVSLHVYFQYTPTTISDIVSATTYTVMRNAITSVLVGSIRPYLPPPGYGNVTLTDNINTLIYINAGETFYCTYAVNNTGSPQLQWSRVQSQPYGSYMSFEYFGAI